MNINIEKRYIIELWVDENNIPINKNHTEEEIYNSTLNCISFKKFFDLEEFYKKLNTSENVSFYMTIENKNTDYYERTKSYINIKEFKKIVGVRK